MLSVPDSNRYAAARALRNARSPRDHAIQELILPMLLFGSAGGIAWAIRGTSGWGGIDGAIVPGMLWAILWSWLCWRKGIAAGSGPLWLGLGIALGGELGYGQYVSWIRGEFHAGDAVLHVAPIHGWAWFCLCGMAWAAPGAVLLGWATSARSSWRIWIGRLTAPVVVAILGWLLVQYWPVLFFPNHTLGLYAGPLDKHLDRTVYTNTQNFTVVAWWAGAMLTALVQRDKTTFVMGGLIGGGFGIGFMSSAAWCLGYVYAPGYVDWWKVWEIQAGFNLGALIAMALYWCIRQTDRAQNPAGDGAAMQDPGPWATRAILETLAAVPFVLAIHIERQPFTSAIMALIYVLLAAGMIFTARGIDAGRRAVLRTRICLIACVFLFLFATWDGATLRLGVLLDLYPAEAVAQYDWPVPRLWLFVPGAALIVLGTLYRGGRLLRRPATFPDHDRRWLDDGIADLITGLAAVGAVTIWPEKIAVLYAGLLCMAIAARNRIV